MTKSDLIHWVTVDYINDIRNTPTPLPSPSEIQAKLLARTNMAIEERNAECPRNEKWRKLCDLEIFQIAEIMAELYPIARIYCREHKGDSDSDLLAIYMDSGENEGIYSTSEDIFRNIANEYNRSLDSNQESEIIKKVKRKAPRRQKCQNPDLIAVNNGIFDYSTKQLMPFSKDFVFLSKSRVDYNTAAQNVVIHNTLDGTKWDVETWMNELSDDHGIVNLLWEVLGAVIRPNVRWKKAVWFYSELGNNGKGTLCSLMRNLCGDGTYASIPIADFEKRFALTPLLHASAVIVDENNVGEYIDSSANLKAVISNDIVQIEEKYKAVIKYQFFGIVVQCLNEYPRVRDKTESFYRRQLFVPFEKCFTGKERSYIKEVYLNKPEVLQYVLKRVLHMNYYELSEPAACRFALEEYKEFNDPVRQFMAEMNERFVWDLVPNDFLYDLYKAWYDKNISSISGKTSSKISFLKDLRRIVEKDFPEWHFPVNDKGKPVNQYPGNKMSVPEPLILEYNLTDWFNPSCSNKNPRDVNSDVLCRPTLSSVYQGMVRVNPRLSNNNNITGQAPLVPPNTDPVTGIIGGQGY